MIKKKIKWLKTEYKKRNAFLQQEQNNYLLKFVAKNVDLQSSKYVLAKAQLMKKKKKKNLFRTTRRSVYRPDIKNRELIEGNSPGLPLRVPPIKIIFLF